ncbi:glutamine--fructose-6-phosphate transaminase [Fimbriimonas ginsengisoli Gsoil 348]|uniref:Glutamine--fructose-6-phosphate transaminase n=2 Tax=Fimbriimonas ginsengisoli TaxID=1005039 RepID=A0A068NWY6_FIMGI|nr:glutamine--fructose-6-phosphate transaminase [Fimbriimonas ginsengisoli Gsoil 348]
MEQEIREQPDLLAKNAAGYFESAREATRQAVGDRGFDMVLLAARGSSDNAALYARYLIEVFLGIPAMLAAPSVITQFHRRIRYPRCLAIGISQSGAAPDVAEVLAAMREDGHATLAITNTAGSRLTREADHSILMNCGAENSVAATKTYSASLLALYQVVRALGGELPDPADLLPNDAWIETARNAAVESSGTAVRCQPVFALGRTFGFSTCQEAALKLMECALIPCKAYSSADFEHGPKALAGHGSAIISFDGPKPDLAAQGCAIVQAPECRVEHEPLEPLWDAMFGQWLALSAARARGLDPDRPQHIRKVTETL